MDTQIKVCVIVENTNKILLIKEWSDNKNGYYWNIIKGTFESSLDESIAKCAIREAREEAGITISLTNFVNILIKHGYNTRIYINFTGSIIKGKPCVVPKDEQLLRNENIIEFRWFTKKELKNLNEDEFINDVVSETVDRWIKGEIYPLSILMEKV